MDYARPAFACLLPHIGGIAGGFITRSQIKNWYDKDLKKPSWRPPNWVFGPAWTALYTGMGYASYLVWRDGGGFNGAAAGPLALYGTQLALNWAWTPIFFGAHRLGLAALDITAMAGCIGGCIYSFHGVNRHAAYLMVPYLAWVSFASAINWWCYLNNPSSSDKIKEIKD